MWFGLLVTAGLVALDSRSNCWHVISVVDWTVVGVALALMAVSMAAAALYGLDGLWTASLQWPLYAAAYLVLRRCVVGLSAVERRWLLTPTMASMLMVCLVGSTRASAALHDHRAARAAEMGGDYVDAVAKFRRAEVRARQLGLAKLEESSRIGRARALSNQGEQEAARRVLGIPADRVIVIAADQWEGPAGPSLAKNVSCWEDVWLLAGTVEVEIQAEGRPARGEWPRVRVELMGELLGEVEVGSAVAETFTFPTQVATGRHRLEVSLVNGFWSSAGEHRWAQLGTARIRYGE